MKKILIALLMLSPALISAQTLDTLDADYDILLNQYKNKTINPKAILTLLLQTKDRKNEKLSSQMAKEYKEGYLDKGDFSKKIESRQAFFIWPNASLFTINDRVFDYLYKYPVQADGVFKREGYSQGTIDEIITRTFIEPVIKRSPEHLVEIKSWYETERIITARIDKKTAHRTILAAKTAYYLKNKEWASYITCYLEKLESEESVMANGWMARGYLNNFIYNVVFPHSTDKTVLNKCAKIMEEMLAFDPESHGHIDTYACILYKAGLTEKAVKEEDRAVSLAKKKNDQDSVRDYTDKIAKMKNNEPFWENMPQ
jgi:hypothetical protein